VLEQFDPAAIAAFVASLATVIAIANSRPPQWGIRRIAFGIAICAASITAVFLTDLEWLFVALFWGGYQIYIGWGFISQRSRITAERHQFVTATTRVLSYVALCDGAISPQESEIIKTAYARAGFTAIELEEVDLTMRDCMHAFAYDGSDPERLASLLKEACAAVAQHSDNQTLFIVLRTALRIAASDGFVSLTEEKALRAVTTWLGFKPEDMDGVWREIIGEAERGDRGTATSVRAAGELPAPQASAAVQGTPGSSSS
jgi:tellurite resistance protein